ncbi:hypothetical protein SAMN05444267_102665 [Chryseobacterium polytrichastri]|uniref:Uncharacterized protein n=1 Tax=Chryseobacterium polytrichastri TaxID=1302687 RepID=A0A1M7E165_9FLAO|nr:hypothetical protein SAMN05444267_102665 [Chryseobacterium polytrichastri]
MCEFDLIFGGKAEKTSTPLLLGIATNWMFSIRNVRLSGAEAPLHFIESLHS